MSQQQWPAATYEYGVQAPQYQLSSLATAVRVLLGGMAAAAAANAYIRFDRASLVEGALGGGTTFAQLTDADDRAVAGIVFYALGLIVTGVVFIIWQFRYAKNAQALGANQGLGPGWAIGGWLIPCANYILGPVQLFQSSKGSNPVRRGAGIVAVWGVLFGGSTALMSLAYFGLESDSDGNFVVNSAEDVESLASSDRLAGVALLLLIAAAILAIVMVSQLTSAQSTARPVRPSQGNQYSSSASSSSASFGAPPPSFGEAPPPAQPQSPPIAPPSQSSPPDGDAPPPPG